MKGLGRALCAGGDVKGKFFIFSNARQKGLSVSLKIHAVF